MIAVCRSTIKSSKICTLSLVNLPKETSGRTTLSLGVTAMQGANKSAPFDEHMNMSREPNTFIQQEKMDSSKLSLQFRRHKSL